MAGFLAFLLWFESRADGAVPFSDTPANHWAYEGLARAKRDGLLVGYPDGLVYHEPPKTRYSHAASLLFVSARYRDLAAAISQEHETVEALGPTDQRVASYRLDHHLVLALRSNLAFLRRAEAEFLPQILEFRRLVPRDAVSVGEVERASNRVRALGLVSPGERLQPFRDVPSGHWAAKAIRDLRAWGLVDGYPDKSFGR